MILMRYMWWSMITLTTVGYGDVSPMTSLGKLVGAATAIMGICVVALLTGIVATAFANHKPVITCERDDFYEFEAVREYLQRRQIGIIIKNTPFHQGDWQESIKKALKLTVKNKTPLNGEIEIAEIVQQMLS